MRIKYDGNGNILNLKRNGITQSAADNRLDSLVYHYQSMSNKLDFVEDLKDTKDSTLGDIRAGQQTGNYQYDASGNLIQDLSEEIQRITWTASGKVWKIERMANSSSSDVEFKYDAFGRRYLKIEKPRGITGFSLPQQWTYTRYENDAQGNLMAVYQTKERSSLTQWEEPGYGDQFIEVQTRLLGNPIYGSTRIGMANTQARIVNIVRVETVSSNTTITVSEVKVDKATYYGNKRYELVGNTGSVHVVISDRKIVTSSGISADILEVNDYYAWGQEIKSRSWTIESDRYLFGYQDMLRENTVNGEGNMYSTEFRMFDARLGRWMSLDPLMDQFPWMSPFVGMDNNPISLVDPLGLNTIEKDTPADGYGGPGDGENNGFDGKGNTPKADDESNKSETENNTSDQYNKPPQKKYQLVLKFSVLEERRSHNLILTTSTNLMSKSGQFIFKQNYNNSIIINGPMSQAAGVTITRQLPNTTVPIYNTNPGAPTIATLTTPTGGFVTTPTFVNPLQTSGTLLYSSTNSERINVMVMSNFPVTVLVSSSVFVANTSFSINEYKQNCLCYGKPANYLFEPSNPPNNKLEVLSPTRPLTPQEFTNGGMIKFYFNTYQEAYDFGINYLNR